MLPGSAPGGRPDASAPRPPDRLPLHRGRQPGHARRDGHHLQGPDRQRRRAPARSSPTSRRRLPRAGTASSSPTGPATWRRSPAPCARSGTTRDPARRHGRQRPGRCPRPAHARSPAGRRCSPSRPARTPGKGSTARRWTPCSSPRPSPARARLLQYAGRILRPYDGKATAEVHDYHDELTGVLASSLAKRAPGYTSLGFPDPRKLPYTPSAAMARPAQPERTSAVKRIVVRLSGMPFDPTYEIDDDTVAVGDPVRVPGSDSLSSRTARPAPSSPWKAPTQGPASVLPEPSDRVPAGITHRIHFSCEPTARRGEAHSWSRYLPLDPTAVWPGSGRCDTLNVFTTACADPVAAKVVNRCVTACWMEVSGSSMESGGVVVQADGQRGDQLAAAGLGQDPAAHAGAKQEMPPVDSPATHTNPRSGRNNHDVGSIGDLSLYGSLGLGGRSRCVAAAPWAGWPPDRVAAAKISTALDTLVGTNEALAASSPVDSGGHGRAHAAAMLAERQGAGIGGLDPGWCYADDRLRTLRWSTLFPQDRIVKLGVSAPM